VTINNILIANVWANGESIKAQANSTSSSQRSDRYDRRPTVDDRVGGRSAGRIAAAYAQNSLHTFPRNFTADGKLPTCYGLDAYLLATRPTSPQQVVVIEFR